MAIGAKSIMLKVKVASLAFIGFSLLRELALHADLSICDAARAGAKRPITFWATDRAPKPPKNLPQRAIKHR